LCVCVCVWLCACVRAHVCVCMCVCGNSSAYTHTHTHKANLQKRIQIIPANDTHSQHFANFHHVDIALDCFPYSGTTTRSRFFYFFKKKCENPLGSSTATKGSKTYSFNHGLILVYCYENFVFKKSKKTTFFLHFFYCSTATRAHFSLLLQGLRATSGC
jgi:hypothetical protein